MATDLGTTYGPCEPCCMTQPESKKHYPTVHLETPEDLELGKRGTVTFAFKRVEHAESDRDGKECYRCVIELQELVSSTDTGPTEEDDAEEADDEYMSARGDEALDMLRKKKAK